MTFRLDRLPEVAKRKARTMTDLFEAEAPELLQRLKKSPVVSVSYHVRPPAPYYHNYDWSGLSKLAPAQQKAKILEYETHGLDLVTGKPTERAGGYQKLKDLLGYAPLAASASSETVST